MRLVQNFAPLVDREKIVGEIEESPQRETAFGLFRVDAFGQELSLLQVFVESYLEVGMATGWAMRHRSGGDEVKMHNHNHWQTAIWYPRAHPSALLLTTDCHFPEAADLVLLDWGEAHGIAPNSSNEDRFSVVFTYAT